jgi:hypothetical protein
MDVMVRSLGAVPFVGLIGLGVTTGLRAATAGAVAVPPSLLPDALFWLVGIQGFVTGSGHLFLPGSVADSIGRPRGSPFQREVGLAGRPYGVLGIFADGFGREWWLATTVAVADFSPGAAGGHLRQPVTRRSAAPGNAGALSLGPVVAQGSAAARRALGPAQTLVPQAAFAPLPATLSLPFGPPADVSMAWDGTVWTIDGTFGAPFVYGTLPGESGSHGSDFRNNQERLPPAEVAVALLLAEQGGVHLVNQRLGQLARVGAEPRGPAERDEGRRRGRRACAPCASGGGGGVQLPAEQIREVPDGFLSHALQLHARDLGEAHAEPGRPP